MERFDDSLRESVRAEQYNRPRKSGTSRTFAFAVLAIGLLLGFTLGLISYTSLNDSESSTPLFDERLVTELFENASPAIVEINTTRRFGRIPLPGSGSGSGFIVDREGHIITNNHVIAGATEITINLADGRTLTATKLGTSPADDLALLQVDPKELEGIDPLPLADSSKVRPGQLAVAIGSPFRNFNSITVGVVSGTGRGPTSSLRRPIPNMIQTDAPLNPGNSGGPLLNSDGEVIGVNSSVRTDNAGRGGNLDEFRIGFAVPSNTIKSLLPQLLIAGEVKRPWLGISGFSITEGAGNSQGLPEGIGINRVIADSPAAHAGLRSFSNFSGSEGDVITRVDGQPVKSVEEMVDYFNSRLPGNQVTLSVFREDKIIEIPVILAEWPDT